MTLDDRMAAMVHAVARRLGIHPKHLTGPSRLRPYAHARHLGMGLCHTFTDASITDVARFFRRDRASVYSAIRANSQRLTHNESPLANAWNAIKQEISTVPTTDSETMLHALRTLYSRRHTEMSKLVGTGQLQAEDVSLESRMLTALLRLAEHDALGVPAELPAAYQFTPAELHACLDAQLGRLREANATLGVLDAIESVRRLIKEPEAETPPPRSALTSSCPCPHRRPKRSGAAARHDDLGRARMPL